MMFWSRDLITFGLRNGLVSQSVLLLFLIYMAETQEINNNNNTTTDEFVDYTKGIFKSLDSIFEVFDMPKYRKMQEVQSLLFMFERQCELQAAKKYLKSRQRNIFIVIEGTPSAGARFFGTKLMRHLGGAYVMSPPTCFSIFRQFFDSQDFLLRSAFYALGHYIVAELVKRTWFYKPVVVNRYWQSNAALALTKEAYQGKGLPPRDSELYRWPKDLLEPDIIFLLSKPQIKHSPTGSKRKPPLPKHFAELMIESYLRMRDPAVIDVDGGAFQTNSFTTITMLVNLTQQHLADTYSSQGFIQIRVKPSKPTTPST